MCDIKNNLSAPIKIKVPELSDVFTKHAHSYKGQNTLSPQQHKVINAISRCRTQALGGHVLTCTNCQAQEISYNSCRNRHCPKCQTTKQIRWLEARHSELLPTHYFHVVFTIPHELNPIASYNPKEVYNILFKSAWETVNTLGKDKKRLNGQMGMLSVLHTWGQNLSQHIHLHCMIPGGALQKDEQGEHQWNASGIKYLFPVKVMSKLFGKLFITHLKAAYQRNEFTFKGGIEDLSDSKSFNGLIKKLSKKSWNIYAKEPFNGAQGGMSYLARYLNKIAIGNERIISCDDKHVSFKWRDYSDLNKEKIMKLKPDEFIRRYLSHVLPSGFMRVRGYGFLANASKAKNLTIIRPLLPEMHQNQCNDQEKTALAISTPAKKESEESTAQLIKRVLGIDIELCKKCKVGKLIKSPLPPSTKAKPAGWDTS